MSLPNSRASTLTSNQHEKYTLMNDRTKEKTLDLPPVSPFTSGEGFPYAPEGWPNPGDVWGWKVGRRMNKAGYFQDRYLYLPKSLQKSSRKAVYFQSKPDVIRYLESNFPNMEIEAFFAMFSWLVPSTKFNPTKAVQPLSNTPPVKSLETGKHVPGDIGTLRKLKRKAQSCNPPTRKSIRLFHGSPSLSLAVQDANDIIDLCHLNEEAKAESNKDLKATLHSNMNQPSLNSNDYPNVTILENFDHYLDTLDDMLLMPPTKASLSNSVAPSHNLEDEMMECKKKLSSLLAMDFSSLVSSSNVTEVATLASQIRKDSSLTVDQLVKLKLVEQIPLVREAFLESKGYIEEADKFLANLEANKLKVSILKNEYNELKDQVIRTEAELDKSFSAIQDIDFQILQLQSKRNEMNDSYDAFQRRKCKLTSRQTMVANSIPFIVHEIQLGISDKSNWELKKANCVQRISDIQDKFIPLRGLTF